MKLDVSILVTIFLVVITLNGSFFFLSVSSQDVGVASSVVVAEHSDLPTSSKDSLAANSLAINSETDKKVDNLSIVSSSKHHHHSVSSSSSSIPAESHQEEEEDDSANSASFHHFNDHLDHRNKTMKMKYCANFAPIKELFENHIEPLYTPLVGLLPEDLQLVLLDQTPFLGLSNASCALVSVILLAFVTTWLSLIRLNQNAKSKQRCLLNETIVALNNQLKQAKYASLTYSGVIQDLEEKLSDAKTRLVDQQSAWSDLNEKYQTLVTSNDKQVDVEEVERRVRQELNVLSERYESQVDQLTRELTLTRDELSQEREMNVSKESELHQMRVREAELTETVELLKSNLNSGREISTPKLASSVVVDPSLLLAGDQEEDIGSFDDHVMRLVETQKRVKELEEIVAESKRLLDEKSVECGELARRVAQLSETDKSIRELELQIKVMNELREKDTKQHLRAMSEMDAQVKKKSADAEKVTHLLEQIRVKQERIQELESQFARIERQANQERQTYEKQAHENWLTGRRLDKELKETKNELTSLKEQLSELSAENANLKQSLATAMSQSQRIQPQQQPPVNPAMFFMSPQQQQHLLAASAASRRSMNESSQMNTSTTLPNLDESGHLNLLNDLSASQSDTNVVNNNKTEGLQVDTARPASRSGSQYSASATTTGAAAPAGGAMTNSSTLPSVASYPYLLRAPNPYMFPPFAPPNAAGWPIHPSFYSQQQQQPPSQLTDLPPQNLSSPNPEYANSAAATGVNRQKRLSTSSSLNLNVSTTQRVRSSNSNGNSQQPSPNGGGGAAMMLHTSSSLATHNPTVTPPSQSMYQQQSNNALNSTSNNLATSQHHYHHYNNTSFLNDSVNLSTIQNDSMLLAPSSIINDASSFDSTPHLAGQQQQQEYNYNNNQKYYGDYSQSAYSHGQGGASGVYYNTGGNTTTTANDGASYQQVYQQQTTVEPTTAATTTQEEESNNNFNV